jgi:hypothetical protein
MLFCSDEYVSKSQETQAGIEKPIELWNYLIRNTSGRPYDQKVYKIISIISISASDARCEQSFSRQKGIMGNSGVTSNGDLLRARFLLKDGPRESRHFLITSVVRVFLNVKSNSSEGHARTRTSGKKIILIARMLNECLTIERNFNRWNGGALRKVIEIQITLWENQENVSPDPERRSHA